MKWRRYATVRRKAVVMDDDLGRVSRTGLIVGPAVCSNNVGTGVLIFIYGRRLERSLGRSRRDQWAPGAAAGVSAGELQCWATVAIASSPLRRATD